MKYFLSSKFHDFHVVSLENAFQLRAVASRLLEQIVDSVIAGAVVLVQINTCIVTKYTFFSTLRLRTMLSDFKIIPVISFLYSLLYTETSITDLSHSQRLGERVVHLLDEGFSVTKCEWHILFFWLVKLINSRFRVY